MSHPRHRLMLLATLAIALIPAVPRADDSARRPALERLVAAEHAFAARALSANTRDAFVEFLANDAIVFRPLPEPGRPVWEKRKPSAAKLTWLPERAEVAAAGDLGWTTGPWEWHGVPDSTGKEPPPAYGHFNSVWSLQPDSTWRVALDIGISHPKPATGGVDSVQLETYPAHRWATRVHKSPEARTNLAKMEERYAAEARKSGANALDHWATGDVRFERDGEPPFVNRDRAREALRTSNPLRSIMPQGSRVSSSDDLGYTYGVLERAGTTSKAPPDSSAYTHIWRRGPDGVWRMAAMIENRLRE